MDALLAGQKCFLQLDGALGGFLAALEVAQERAAVCQLQPVPTRFGIALDRAREGRFGFFEVGRSDQQAAPQSAEHARIVRRDRKSTRLNSSHLGISYAVFCLKKK